MSISMSLEHPRSQAYLLNAFLFFRNILSANLLCVFDICLRSNWSSKSSSHTGTVDLMYISVSDALDLTSFVMEG